MTLTRIMKHELRIMLLIVFALFIILYPLFSPMSVYAQSPLSTSKELASRSGSEPTLEVSQAVPSTVNPNPSTMLRTGPLRTGLPSNVNPASPLYTDLLIHNLFHTFSCLGIGQSIIGQPCLTYQLQKNAQGIMQGVPVLASVDTSGGVLGTTTSLIGALYTNRPVRTADYLASVGEDLGIVKEANAQVVGSGALVLNPIRTLWQVSRNISYVIMIIIFLIIGLMVMFRTKINPQTVITAQAALPGLVIGLIMITFSYFLAGLISDMAFVGTNVVGYYFAAAQGPVALRDPDRLNLTQKLTDVSVLRMFGAFAGIATKEQVTGALQAIYDALTPEVQDTVKWFAGFLAFQAVGPLGGLAGPYAIIASPVIGLVAGMATAGAPTQILGFFLSFIATFVLIYAMLKLLLRLVNSYLTIIFLTLSAPFQFLFASLPGRQTVATDWILNMMGNILVFPAIIAVFYFVAFILGPNAFRNVPDFPLKITQSNQIQNNQGVPSVYAQGVDQVQIVGIHTFPLFGKLDLDFVKMLLAFGALVALPAIPDIIVKTVGKAGQAGQILGQEISGTTRSGQGYFQQHTGRLTQAGQSMGTGLFGEHQIGFDQQGNIIYREVRPGIKSYVKNKGWNPIKWFGSAPRPGGGQRTGGV